MNKSILDSLPIQKLAVKVRTWFRWQFEKSTSLNYIFVLSIHCNRIQFHGKYINFVNFFVSFPSNSSLALLRYRRKASQSINVLCNICSRLNAIRFDFYFMNLGKQHSSVQTERNFHKPSSCVTGGLMFDANCHHTCMRLTRDYIKNQKWILHNHIES